MYKLKKKNGQLRVLPMRPIPNYLVFFESEFSSLTADHRGSYFFTVPLEYSIR